MKRFLIVLAAICCCGCNNARVKTDDIENATIYYKDVTTIIYSVEIAGHTYIMFDGGHAGGIIHAEHCKCKEKGQ